MGYSVLPLYASVLTIIYELLIFLAIVLLSTHRGQTLVCAAFIFAVINLMETPIVFFIGIIARPSLNMIHFMEEIYQIPGVYYVYSFIMNIVLMSCCFIAAHWLRKTQLNPPQKLTMLFSIIFIAIVAIIYVWFRDIITIMSVSFFPSALPAVLLAGMAPAIFYFFTRLIAEKEIIAPNDNKEEPSYTRFVRQLSKRELEVIEAILAGYSSQKELAASLNISINTVKTHMKRIYQVTGVSGVDALSLLFHGYIPAHPTITPKSP